MHLKKDIELLYATINLTIEILDDLNKALKFSSMFY